MTTRSAAARPLISAIVPVFNARPWLAQCVDSILGQQGGGDEFDLELILVDDGSTDGGGAMCDEYRERDPRVKVGHMANSGSFVARNTGLDMATGDFLAFCDADDYLEPDAYHTLLALQKETGADAAMGGVNFFHDTKNSPASYMGGTDFFPAPRGDKLLSIEDVAGKPAVRFYNGVTTMLLRRELALRHGMRFRTDVISAADGDFILQLLNIPHRFRYTEKPVYNYRRQMGSSITSTYSLTKRRRAADALFHLNAVRQQLEKEYPKERVDAAMGDRLVSFMIRYLVVCGADSLAGRADAYGAFLAMFRDGELRRLLRFYNPSDPAKRKGRSRLLPWLVRKGWARAAFLLCRHKAALRYGRELAAIKAEAKGKKGEDGTTHA